MNIRQIEAFRAVVQLGSMTKAAELLGISQPAVSRLISDFQDTVGFKLFTRKRYYAEPTTDARLLFEKIEKIFFGLEELSQEIIDIRSAQAGRVTIAATSSYASGLLPKAIAGFKEKYQDISISFLIKSHEEVIDWVASGRADIGFVIQPVAHSTVSVTQFLSSFFRCIMPSDHQLVSKTSLVPKDLQRVQFVSFPRGTEIRFELDNFFSRQGIERLLKVEATSHQAVCSLVAAGLGVAMVNPFAPIYGYGNQVESRPIHPSIKVGLKLLVNEPLLSVCAEKFRDYLLENLPEVDEALAQAGRVI